MTNNDEQMAEKRIRLVTTLIDGHPSLSQIEIDRIANLAYPEAASCTCKQSTSTNLKWLNESCEIHGSKQTMQTSNEQMAALRERLSLYIIRPMQPQNPMADPAVTKHMQELEHRKLDDLMQLITTTTAEAVRNARIDEATKSSIAIEARLDSHLDQSNSFTAQEVIGAYRKNRIAQLTNTKDAV